MKTIRSAMVIGAAALALALGGCGKKNDESATATGSNVTAVEADNGAMAANDAATASANGASPIFSPAQAFANTAASSDAFEIQSSQMALTQGKSAAVKKFAQQMIDAHNASTAKLKSVASGLKPALTPDPALNAEEQAALDQLKGKTDAAFDEAYIAAQRDAHQKALDALRGYGASGDQAALQDWARQTAPTVAAHLNMAKALKP